jgi:hypothetical protein
MTAPEPTDPRPRNEARSKALMEAAIAELRLHPDTMRAQARANIAQVAQAQSASTAYIVEWRRLIELPPDALAAELLGDGDRVITLRSMNPFPVPPDVRTTILALYRSDRGEG